MLNLNVKTEDFFRYPFYTQKGIINNSIVIFFIYLVVNGVDIFTVKIGFLNIFILFSIFYIILSVIWLIFRWNYIYLTKKMIVIFALTIDYENQPILVQKYNELINLFKQNLKENNLDKLIRVVTKHFDICFSDNSAAEAKTKINEDCSTLIISGLPITENQCKTIEFKLNFHYEFKCPKKQIDIYKEMINKTVSKSMINRDWRLFDSIDSKKMLTTNLLTTCSFILGLCAASGGMMKKAKSILKPCIADCNANRIKYKDLIIEVKGLLFKINMFLLQSVLWDLDFKTMEEYVLELYKSDNYDYAALQNMAIYTELKGDRTQAKLFTNRAEWHHPKKVFDFKFSLLYFLIDEKKYDEVGPLINEMVQIFNVKTTNIEFIKKFLEVMHSRTGKISLIFNRGLIDYLWGDKKIGKRDLKYFIINADASCEKLKNVAKNILEEYKNPD